MGRIIPSSTFITRSFTVSPYIKKYDSTTAVHSVAYEEAKNRHQEDDSDSVQELHCPAAFPYSLQLHTTSRRTLLAMGERMEEKAMFFLSGIKIYSNDDEDDLSIRA